MKVFVYLNTFLILILTTIKTYLIEEFETGEIKHCGLNKLKANSVKIDPFGENKRYLKEGVFEPIRVHIDYHFIENMLEGSGHAGFTVKKQDYDDLKDKIMPKTKDVFEKLIKVQRIEAPLKFNTTYCDNYPLPPTYSPEGAGVNADLVIFPMIDDTGMFLREQIEAAAIHCIQHAQTRRPIAGYIIFKPDLKVNNSTAMDYMVWLAVHEITHIFMFNDALYDDWVDENNNPLGKGAVVGTQTDKKGHQMEIIKTKRVVEEAKKHFGCDSIKGVPLEYNGGPGTAGAHWSKRYLNTDYMIGDSYGENLISRISLALFEDSGWYKVDYEMANLLTYGKDVGCSFFDENCITKGVVSSNSIEIQTPFKREFCTNANQPICSSSHIFRGVCGIKRFDYALPTQVSYFNDRHIGGMDMLTDRCPIPIELRSGQIYYGGSCREGTTFNLQSFEKVCPECACFMSSLRKVNEKRTYGGIEMKNKFSSFLRKDSSDPLYQQTDYNASCFEYKCKGANLFVLVDGKEHECKDGTNVSIDGYQGAVVCPSASIMCNQNYKCKFGCTERFSNASPFSAYDDK